MVRTQAAPELMQMMDKLRVQQATPYRPKGRLCGGADGANRHGPEFAARRECLRIRRPARVSSH